MDQTLRITDDEYEKLNSNLAKYYKDLTQYLELKSRYEDGIQSKIRKIKNKGLSSGDRTRLIKKAKEDALCLKCMQKGGMTFEKEGLVLRAFCNVNTPCTFNMEITKPSVYNITDNIDEINSNIRQTQESILETKLDFIFGFAKGKIFEDEVELLTKSHTALTQELKEIVAFKDTYVEKVGGVTDELLQMTSRESAIENYATSIKKEIEEYKENILRYRTTEKKEFLHDAMDIYNTIVILLRKLRKLKYTSVYIDDSEDIPEELVVVKKIPYTHPKHLEGVIVNYDEYSDAFDGEDADDREEDIAPAQVFEPRSPIETTDTPAQVFEPRSPDESIEETITNIGETVNKGIEDVTSAFDDIGKQAQEGADIVLKSIGDIFTPGEEQ